MWRLVTLLLLVAVSAAAPNLRPRIINGTEAIQATTKHQASIRLRISDIFFGSGHICGGSVISRKHILTAAHCVYNFDKKRYRNAADFKIVLGTLDRYSRTNSQFYHVTHYNLYKGNNPEKFIHDVAILHLNRLIPEDLPNIAPIELRKRHAKVGTICHVTGWGLTEEYRLSSKLLAIDAPILDSNYCKDQYGEWFLDGMICAGYKEGERDACEGDSGGPMVCDGVLSGVVSFGNDCALPGYPGIYADVAYYHDWIKSITGGSNSIRISNISLLVFIGFLLALR